MVAHEEGFLEDDAGAAEGVEEARARGEGAAEINEDLGELRGEHADFRIPSGAGLVASSIGVDVLDADDTMPVIIKFDKFDFVGIFTTEAIMERSGGGENGRFRRDDADGMTVASEDFFEF